MKWWKKKKPPAPPRSNVGGRALPISVRSEPLVGYRVWRIKPTPAGMVLYSLNQQYEWKVENTAKCLNSGPFIPWAHQQPPPKHEDPAPSVDCACGFYTSLPDQPLSEWAYILRGRVHASGTVALTGRVIRCSMGFKAEHAEIQSPVVLDVDCANREACDNDVTVVDLQAYEAKGYCADHTPVEGAVVEAGMYMRNTVTQLEARYPGVEFMSWL